MHEDLFFVTLSKDNTVSVWFLTLPSIHSTCPAPLGTSWSQPFPQDTGVGGNLRLRRQQCERRNSSSSASNELLASYVPFPSLHTRSHLFLLMRDKKKDYLSAGGKERMLEAMAPAPQQLWKTNLKEKPHPATVAGLRTRGLLGDRCTVRGARSHQPLQSCIRRHRGCERARDVCERPGRAKPCMESKTLYGDQSRVGKIKFALDKAPCLMVKELRYKRNGLLECIFTRYR